MRLFKKLYQVEPMGILHVGAHDGEEYQEYLANNMLGGGSCIWVEAQPNKAEQLEEKLRNDPKHKVINALAWSEEVWLELKVTTRTASSSVFDLGYHAQFYKDIKVEKTTPVKAVRLDSILSEADSFDFVVLDVQGAELEALRGLGDLLGNVNWVFTEVSKKNLYIGGASHVDVDKFMQSVGFRRRFVEWDRNAGWGDALYVRDEVWKDSTTLRLKRFLSWVYRRIYGRIPQSLFPLLVSTKRRIRNWISKLPWRT